MPENTLHNEKDLLINIAGGDEDAFRQVFHHYTPQLRPLIFKLTRSEEVIEDIVQDVFFKIWISRDKLPEILQFRSWLLKITFRECFGYLRKKKLIERPDNFMIENTVNTSPVEQLVDYKTTALYVQEAINQLPIQAKRVYLLSRQQGLPLQEIADEMQLSLQTVKNTLGRALKSIRSYLEQKGVVLPLLILWQILI